MVANQKRGCLYFRKRGIDFPGFKFEGHAYSSNTRKIRERLVAKGLKKLMHYRDSLPVNSRVEFYFDEKFFIKSNPSLRIHSALQVASVSEQARILR